jgi:hypothetical protein
MGLLSGHLGKQTLRPCGTQRELAGMGEADGWQVRVE